jgi:hypothetical protein
MHTLRLTTVLALLLPLAACLPPSGGEQQSSAASSDMSSTMPSVYDAIQVTEPQPGATVSSPLVVRGQARGTWYFEASFPVHLLDDERNELAVAPAQAQGDWMTEEFVPFEVSLNFTTTATSGFLVLEKDNPSGLPEHAASIEIPVNFAR